MAAEARCEGCGRRLRPGEGLLVEEQVRVRGPLTRRPDGPGYLPREVATETRKVPVCVACRAKIADGASLARLRGRRALLFGVLFLAILLVIAAATPPLLPLVRSALWLN